MIDLPPNCQTEYLPQFLTESESHELYEHLISNYDVTDRTVKMADGSAFIQETGTYMFLDDGLQGFDRMPEVWGQRATWPALLKTARDRIEGHTGHQFQVCRCIYYENGDSSCDFHADYMAYGPTNVIASLSLGAEREFILRDKENPAEQFKILLENGSLFVMGEGCQENYEHALPKDESCHEARLNLTFRKYEKM